MALARTEDEKRRNTGNPVDGGHTNWKLAISTSRITLSMYPIKHHLQDTGPQVRSGVQRGKGLGNGEVLTAGLRSETSEASHAKVKEARSGSAGERGSQGVNRLGSESSGVSSRRWRVPPSIRQSSSFPGDFSECEMHDPPGEPGARKSHAGLCVQSRLACSAGVSPARVEIRAL